MGTFKIGMYLAELHLPFAEALATAQDIGVKHIWYSDLAFEKQFEAMSDAEIDAMAGAFADHGMDIFLLTPGSCFKQVHLTDLELDRMEEHPAFRAQMQSLERRMEVARHLGVQAVGTFTFAWPGEYTAGRPTWPMRWITRGGIIADVDMEKLTKAFSLIADKAEQYGVDVALGQMPWNYTNTTGNFRRIAEAVGSPRIKVMWGPADNMNSGEGDVATAGFRNIRPYLYGLHLKDLRVNDGVRNDFEYCPIGEGDVDFPTVLQNLRDAECDVYLSLSTHFRPEGGTYVDAMRINYDNLQGLIAKAG